MIPRESNNRLLNQKPLEQWLAEHFNKNTPLDKVVYELVTATGDIDKNPAGIYFVANPSVDKITDSVTRMFLGVQLQCAQCHNHPFTDWKQTEYWAMASFFHEDPRQGTAKGAAREAPTPSVAESNKAINKKGALPESAKIVPASSFRANSRRSHAGDAAHAGQVDDPPPTTSSSPAPWSTASGISSMAAVSSTPWTTCTTTTPPRTRNCWRP